MAQPMEDTNIKNSLTFLKTLHNDGSTLGKKVLQHEKEEMDIVFLHESCNKEVERQKNEQTQNNKLLGTQSFEKAFPWLITFDKVMHSSIGKKSFHFLERLLSIYVNNISKSLEANYIMTFEVIKLKKHLNNTLTFFHFYWHDINEHTSDHNSYLNKMSVLLAIYVDTELRTSKRSKDPSKVATKLFSALWIYLSKSEEHIFKALLGIKLLTKRYAKICDPIFSKIFTKLKTNQESMTSIKYVRYLLLLKLWRKIKEDTKGEKKVDELAVKILGSHMPKMHIDLLTFLPKLPLNCENETLWLMQPNLFDLKQACNDFVRLEEKIEMTDYTDLTTSLTTTMEMCNHSNFKINPNTMEDTEACTINHTFNKNQRIDFNESELFQDVSKENNYFIKKKTTEKVNKMKKSKFVPNIKSGEIIVIDFSKEDKEPISSNKRRKNKFKKNLGWLRIVAKRCKSIKNIKYEQQIGIADVCNTDNSMDSKHIQPCSDDKDNKTFKHIKNISFLKKEESVNDVWYINPKQECAVTKNCDNCVSLLKSKEKQLNNVLHLLIALKLIGQNNKNPASLLKILQEYEEGNSSLQNITFDEKDSNITTLLSQISENGLIKSQLNEMQSRTDLNSTKNTDNYKNMGIGKCQENYLSGTIISDKDYNLTASELKKQNLSHDINVNSNCCDKIGINSNSNSDYFNINKVKETVSDTDNDESDTKPIFDNKIISILSDLERCMHVLGRISKHVMNVHIKKSDLESLNEKTDSCADSNTIMQEQTTESLNNCISQNLNVLNTPEIYQILKLCGQKNEMKNCNSSYSQERCTSTQEVYDCGECKHEKKISTDLTKFGCNENQQLTKCRLLQNIDCGIIKAEIEKTQYFCDNKRNPEYLAEQLQKTDVYQTCTANTKTQMETCAFDSRESESLQNYDKNDSPLLNDYSQTTAEDNIIKIDSMVDYEDVNILDNVLDTTVNRDFLDNVKTIDIKESTGTDIINKQNMLGDTQSSLTSLIDQDSFCNVSNSSEHIVNPYLIKTRVEEKALRINKPNGINGEWYSQEMANVADASVVKNDELYNNKKRPIGRCVDIVAFGLNAKEEEDFDLFALDDSGSISMLKNMSSTRSSPLLIPSDVKISESTEFSPKCTSNDIRMEQVYDFQEIDILKEDRLKTDALNQTLTNDGCTSRDIPSNVLINYFPIQTEDRSASSYNYTSVYPSQLDLEPLSAEQLIETPNLSLPFGQHDLTLYNPMSVDSQCTFTENDNVTTQQFVHGLQSIESYELIQQNIKMSSDNNQLYTNQKETSQVSLSSHVLMEQERLSKVLENSNNLWKQGELSDLNDTLPQKKRILMNFQGKPIPSIILKNGMENDHPIIMITDGISRDKNLLYKVESKGNILISTEKLCLKSSKGNITRPDTQISKIPVVKEKSMEEISTKISIRPNIRRLDITSFNGEASVKRRKVTPNLLPLLDTGRLMYSTNTQTQGKDLLSGIKEFTSTNNTNHKIV